MKITLPILRDVLDRPVAEKWNALAKRCGELLPEGVIVAFSGGVDSSLLLVGFASARDSLGCAGLEALIVTGPALPQRDLLDARSLSARLKVRLVEVEGKELEIPGYRSNRADRCFHCKSHLFEVAHELKGFSDASILAYGYTASDVTDDRPGHRAATMHEVRTPLSDVGLTKEEIRSLLAWLGFTDLGAKPASPCYASRIEQGMEVTEGRLRHVAELETALESLGVRGARARICRGHFGEYVRVECSVEHMGVIASHGAMLHALARQLGYRTAVLDLGGYRRGGASGLTS